MFFFWFVVSQRKLRLILKSDELTGGDPSLPEDSRDSWIAWFHTVMTDRETLCEHIRFLQQLGLASLRHTGLPEEKQTEAFLNDGPEALDDKQLARLILNPVALSIFQDEIYRELPAAWIDAIIQKGEELIEKENICIPEFPR